MLRRLSFMSACLSFCLCISILVTSVPQERQPQLVPTVSNRPATFSENAYQRFAQASYSASRGDDLTQQDVIAAAAKWDEAYPALDAFWRGSFAQHGIGYTTPRVVSMNANVVSTGCGVVERSGPFYCAKDHTIYYDPIFVAGEMKKVGGRLGTDGDMAAITIMAHEWGHAVQRLLGRLGRGKYTELQADCLAGAFANYGLRAGHLQQGDVEEAEMGLAIAGDAHGDHGSPRERMNSFALGFQTGGGACWH